MLLEARLRCESETLVQRHSLSFVQLAVTQGVPGFELHLEKNSFFLLHGRHGRHETLGLTLIQGCTTFV